MEVLIFHENKDIKNEAKQELYSDNYNTSLLKLLYAKLAPVSGT
jgi:hypothetical protein